MQTISFISGASIFQVAPRDIESIVTRSTDKVDITARGDAKQIICTVADAAAQASLIGHLDYVRESLINNKMTAVVKVDSADLSFLSSVKYT